MRQTTSILLRNAARRDLGKEIKILSNDGGWEPCFTLPQERYCSLTYLRKQCQLLGRRFIYKARALSFKSSCSVDSCMSKNWILQSAVATKIILQYLKQRSLFLYEKLYNIQNTFLQYFKLSFFSVGCMVSLCRVIYWFCSIFLLCYNFYNAIGRGHGI